MQYRLDDIRFVDDDIFWRRSTEKVAAQPLSVDDPEPTLRDRPTTPEGEAR
jgi:hypothetical protein